ncbi:MAG: hypothetical protein WD492_16340 [Alkalispirochaeta sp.]
MAEKVCAVRRAVNIDRVIAGSVATGVGVAPEVLTPRVADRAENYLQWNRWFST